MKTKNIICTLLFALLLFKSTEARAIENTDTILNKINIPLLVISTDDGLDPEGYKVDHPEGCVGSALTGNEYKTGRLVMMLMDSVIYDSGDYLAGASGVRLRQRGNSSALWNKKSYKVKLSKKYDLFQRDDSKYKNKDWVLLNNPLLDLNSHFGFSVCKLLGQEWTPEVQYVNVLLNGDYKGLYVLSESVEQGKGRYDVSDSGFIIEDDAYWWNEDVYFKGELLPYYVGYTFKYPDADDVSEEYIAKIRNYIIEVERRLESNDDIGEYIDIESFARGLLGYDILGSEDAVGSNRYICKYDFIEDDVTSTKLKLGPLWDFDNLFARKGKWSQQHSGNYRFYFKYLLNYEEFIDEYVRLWNSVKETLYNDLMELYNDFQLEYGEALDISREMDARRWGKTSYKRVADDVDIIDKWLQERIVWIDEQLKIETSIEMVENEEPASGIYTLDGRKVDTEGFSTATLSPGIYIANGRKIIVR